MYLILKLLARKITTIEGKIHRGDIIYYIAEKDIDINEILV
jgi:hypothetical protein